MKYEYMLQTWGGFYNKEYKKIHKQEEGYNYFDTKEERASYVRELRRIERALDANHLVVKLEEGYHTRVVVIAHRITRYKGKDYHTTWDFSPCYPFESAVYFMENKWYLGFNDYPLGEDFDYDNPEVSVVAEWIEGALSI